MQPADQNDGDTSISIYACDPREFKRHAQTTQTLWDDKMQTRKRPLNPVNALPDKIYTQPNEQIQSISQTGNTLCNSKRSMYHGAQVVADLFTMGFHLVHLRHELQQPLSRRIRLGFVVLSLRSGQQLISLSRWRLQLFKIRASQRKGSEMRTVRGEGPGNPRLTLYIPGSTRGRQHTSWSNCLTSP